MCVCVRVCVCVCAFVHVHLFVLPSIDVVSALWFWPSLVAGGCHSASGRGVDRHSPLHHRLLLCGVHQ